MQRNWRWAYDDTNSDLSGGAGVFNKRMLPYAENAGSITVFNDVQGSDVTGWFFSPAGQPGTDVWPAGPWAAHVDVVDASPRISLDIALARVGPTGTFKQTYAAFTAPQVLSPTGLYIFGGTTTEQAADPGDRLRASFRFTRDGTAGVDNQVGFGFGDPVLDFLEVPILMANPRITYNGIALDFPGPLTGYRAQPVSDRAMVRSAGVVHATNLSAKWRKLRIALDRFDNVAFWDNLKAWWAWAAQGKQYAFAFDSGDVVDKTLSGSAAAGQKDIPIADTSSIVAGKKYLVRQASGHGEEIIQVDTITTNVKVVALANLKYAYVSGDIFRSQDYFPKVVSLDQDAPFDENAGLTYSFDHSCEEDRG